MYENRTLELHRTVLTWEKVAGVRTVLSAKRVCLFVCLFVCLCVCLFVCVFLSFFLSFFLFVRWSLCGRVPIPSESPLGG